MAERSLKDVKVGDMVCIPKFSGWGRSSLLRLSKSPVEKVTKTQVIAFNGMRFQKSTGKEIGRNYGDDRLCLLTAELQGRHAQDLAIHQAEIECYNAHERLRRVRGNDAIRIAALLPDELKAKP